MKFIVDKLPEYKVDCPMIKYSRSDGVFLCKPDNKPCNLKEGYHIQHSSCRWLMECKE